MTCLLIEDYHWQTGHQGTSSSWTALCQSCWILKAPATVQKVLGKRLFWRRYAHPGIQMMAYLLKKMTPTKPPFHFTGVYSFRPFIIRQRNDVKHYGCIFTCFNTRAVHLEVAHSLTTHPFIAVLSRFMSREGTVLCEFIGTSHFLLFFLEV